MRRIRSWIAPFALLGISTLSCGDDVATGPVDGGLAQLSLQPLPAPLGPGGVTIASVRVLLERPADESVAADTIIVFPPNADSVAVDVPVALRGFAEQLLLTLSMRDDFGLEVFRAGPTPVMVMFGEPVMVAPAVTYVGAGASATTVRVLNADTTLFFGEQLAVSVAAEDGSGTLVPQAPVLWQSLDPAVAQFPDFNATVLQVGQQRGVARVVASLYTGSADTLLVQAQPQPTAIAAFAGDQQSEPAGSLLPQPLVARVTGADGLGVEGVWVRFAVTSGDGQLEADSVLTDASGDAAVAYQLGSSGTHTVDASVGGLGTVATFTIDATFVGGRPIMWVASAGGLWSDPANWSTGTVPAVQDTALVTLDGTYTVTLDVDASVDALVLGASTGTQTLTGTGRTLTVAGDATVGAAGLLSLAGGSVSGTGMLVNQGSSTLRDVSIDVPLTNDGILRLRSGSVSLGFTTTVNAQTRLEAYGGATNTLAFASGWTNEGTLVLSHGGNGGGQDLSVTVPGSITNDVGATMIVEAGIGGGNRILNGTLDNRGTLDVRSALSINGAGAGHTNSGTFLLTTGNVTITQSGASPSFMSSGTLTVGGGRSLTISGGALVTNGSTLDGTGSVSLSGVAWDVGSGYTVTGLAVSMTGGSLSGQNALTNRGSSTVLRDVTVSAPLVNDGLLYLRSGAVNGGFTTTATAQTRLEAFGAATNLLTFASGWTNLGTLVLSHGGNGGGQTLTVTIPGMLVNAVGATMIVEAGVGGGGRVLTAALDNRGSFDARTGLTINGANAAHLNSGSFDLTSGNVVVTQSGASPSFATTGTVTIGAGRTLSISGGSLVAGGAALAGTGTLALSNVMWSIGQGYTVTGLTVSAAGGALTGQGSLVNQGPSTTLLDVSVGVPLLNEALLRLRGSTAVSAGFATTSAAQTRLEAWGGSTNSLTFAAGWTNLGTLVLSHGGNGGGQTLTVTIPGTLVNGGGATMIVEAGVGNGGRVLTATLDNQGSFDARFPLTINGANANHLNSGIFELTTGDVVVTQAGGQPTFTSSGAILVGAARTLTVTGGSFWSTVGGGLEGSGTIDVLGTSFASDGLVAPGGPLGTLTLRGDYPSSQLSVMDLELGGTVAGTDYDRLAITGTANLQGDLTVSLANNFVPQAGQQFLIVTHGSAVGRFGTVTLPPPPLGLQWALSYQPTGVLLTLN